MVQLEDWNCIIFFLHIQLGRVELLLTRLKVINFTYLSNVHQILTFCSAYQH